MSIDCQAVAVTGATGPVGRYLLAALAGSSAAVLAISRNPPTDGFPPGRIRWVRAELSQGWPEEADAPCVLSAGPLAELAAGLARRAPRGLQRLIVLSSTSARFKQSSADPRERAEASRLLAAEASTAATARALGAALTVLRPTMIYGGGDHRRLGSLIAFARATRILPLPWPARGLRQPVHAEDLALLMLALLARPLEGVLEVGGGERLSAGDMIRRFVQAALGFPPLPVPVPAAVGRLLLPRWRGPLSRLAQDQLPQPAPELAALGWQPRPFRPEAPARRRR